MVLKANTEQFVAADELPQRIWSGPGFWWAWVGATTLGWAVTYAAAGALSGLTGESESPLTRGTTVLLTLVTLTLQWRALRPWLERAWRWIPVSFAGEAAGLALFLAAQVALRGLLAGETVIPEALSELFLTSLPPAIAQWLLLRTVARRSWRWLVANLFWMLLFIPVVLFFALLGADADAEGIEPLTGVGPALQQALFSAVFGAILGFIASAITGAEMAWLLRHPRTGGE
jgi:hypothetical protein